MKSNLNTINWQYFKLSDLFIFDKGKDIITELENGTIPLASSTDKNNGITKSVSEPKKIFNGNKITYNSNGSVGFCYYQKTKFCATTDVSVLDLKNEKMTRNKALFLITVLKNEKYRYNYGLKPNLKRLNLLKIKLPAKNGKPDWNFMEKFIDTHTYSYNYATKPVQNLPTPELKPSKWKSYELSELFDIKYGVNLELVNLEETTKDNRNAIRLVSRTDHNNGISAFVKKQIEYTPNPANTISVAGGGSVLAAFLQTAEYYSGRDIYYLKPRQKLNNAILLFIATLIRKEKYRFNYGRQANKSLKALTIKLPVKNNHPDWNFMTNFMQTLPFSSQV